MTSQNIRIGIIGGSGLYAMPQLTDVEEHEIMTPFGKPSDAIITGTLSGERVAFIARHGRGHVYLPTEVPYQANIYALKSLGVHFVIAVSACGSLREDYAPGNIVIPDQLFDNTRERTRTFFGEGIVAHISTADPFCKDLSKIVLESVKKVPAAADRVRKGGAYIAIEGPRFSTRAESNVYRSWGMSLIGMTAAPEAFLACEAEMCYALMAHITDYDVWRDEEPVSVEMVTNTFKGNLSIAQEALLNIIDSLKGQEPTCDCTSALAPAVMTDKARITPEMVERLQPIIGKYYA